MKWTRYPGRNCYNGHGGRNFDLGADNKNPRKRSIEEAKLECERTGLAGFTYHPRKRRMFRLQSVDDTRHFTVNPKYDVYSLERAKSTHPGGSDLIIESKGTPTEPCFVVRDPFHDQGLKVMERFRYFCKKLGIPEPTPKGDDRWMSWQGSDNKFKTFKLLDDMADRILHEIRETQPATKHLKTKDCGRCSGDINVYSKGGGTGPHQDAQQFGRLVFVFCAGNRCKSSVWFGGSPVPNSERGSTRERLAKKGYKEIEIEMQSGDCMVFEGKTWHQVHQCIPHTSPSIMKGSFLENRRLSILVRKI